MSKVVGEIFGLILCIMVAVWFLGATTLQSEKTAFVQETAELTQRLKEEGGVYDPASPTNSVTAYLTKINGTTTAADPNYLLVTQLNLKDNDGSGGISYGDVITYKYETYTTGAWDMRKTDAKKAEQGIASDKPSSAYFTKTVEILVDRR